MQAREILSQSRDAMNARRVFGDPIERDGVTVVPVMRLLGGAGGGGGEENASLGGAAAAEDGAIEPAAGLPRGVQGAAASFGVGFGVKATPAGVYVIKGDGVQWLPAIEPERIVFIGGVIGIVALLVLRSILRMAIKR